MTLLSSAINRLSQLLTVENLAKVNEQGFLIIDHALPNKIAKQLHDEILRCHSNGLMGSNHTAYVESRPVTNTDTNDEQVEGSKATITRLYAKPHIFEAEVLEDLLSSPDISIPGITSVSTELIPFLDAKLAANFEPLLLYEGDTSIKLQVNQGGGCFPLHFDSPGGLKDTRRITCLIYLNEDWQQDHGGELCMQPFLRHPVEIAPLFNRMVLFRSDRMLHRVNVSNVQRVCLTIWAHGRGDDGEDPRAFAEQINDDFTDSWMSMISRPSVQRVLSKAIYSEQWKQSYRMAHAGTGGDIALPESIDNDVAALLEKPGLDKVVPLLLSIADDKTVVTVKGYGSADVDGALIPEADDHSDADTDDDMPLLTKDVKVEDLGFLDFL